MASDNNDNTRSGADLIPRPIKRKAPRTYSPSRDGFFDIMQEVMYDKLTVPATQNDVTKHIAIIYRVVKEEGFLGIWPDVIKVRARIAEPDTTHSTLIIPKDFEDVGVINTLVEFQAQLEDLGGKTPKLGDPIEVEFYNNDDKLKMFGNGIIKKLLPASKVTGQETLKQKPIASAFKPAKEKCQTKGGLKPSSGAPLIGQNKAVTVSERDPRKLNSPTEDSTSGIAQSRSQRPESPTGTPSISNTPAESRTGSNPTPVQPSPGTNTEPPKPKGQDCEEGKISTVGETIGQPGQPGSPTPGGNLNAANTSLDGGQGPGPKTWDRYTNRRILKMHPESRHMVANFINQAQQSGYYLRITETYRTVKRQNELYAKGRTTPKRGKTVTKAKGLPKSSIHQFGIAFDCVEVGSGRDKRTKKKFKADWATNGRTSGFSKGYPRQRWHLIGDFGKSFGFVWGGNFRGFFDGPHFEVFRARASQLRRKEARGEIVIDPRLGPNYKFPKF